MEKTANTTAFRRVAEVKPICRNRVKPADRPQITSSTDCYNVLQASWDMGRIEFVEQFKVLLLNRANRVLGIYEVSTGGVVGTVADPKPGGPAADQEDKKGGELLDIAVLDHINLTSESYYSVADEGLL